MPDLWSASLAWCHVAPVHALPSKAAEHVNGPRPAWSYVALDRLLEPKLRISDIIFAQSPNLMPYITLVSAYILLRLSMTACLVLDGFRVD